MRVKKSLINAKFNFLFSLINLILGFISRSIFIKYLGDVYLGYNTFIMSVLGVLNLAELGIGAAVNYSLYKPIKDNDEEKISEIMYIFKILYGRIGKTIFICGLLIVPFIAVIVKKYMPLHEALVYYLLLLISTSITYFFSYKQTLIFADQNGYIVNLINGVIIILKNIVQIIILVVSKKYLLWLIVNIVCNILSILLVNKEINKRYKNVNFDLKGNYNEIKKNNTNLMKNMKNTFFHKFAEIIVCQTDPIVISAFATLSETGKYANYLMIINGINQIISSLLQGFTASIGNLIAEGEKNKIYDVFKQLNLLGNYISTMICFCSFMVINDFVKMWIGEKYTFSPLIIFIIIINLYITLNRGFIDSFKAGFGIYWDVWAPILEGIINLVISLILAYKFGIIGVFIGTLISNLIIIVIWKPFAVFKYGLKEPVCKYYKMYATGIVRTLITSIISYLLINVIMSKLNISNYFFVFLIKGINSFIIINLLLCISLFKNREAINLIKRFRKNIKINK